MLVNHKLVWEAINFHRIDAIRRTIKELNSKIDTMEECIQYLSDKQELHLQHFSIEEVPFPMYLSLLQTNVNKVIAGFEANAKVKDVIEKFKSFSDVLTSGKLDEIEIYDGSIFDQFSKDYKIEGIDDDVKNEKICLIFRIVGSYVKKVKAQIEDNKKWDLKIEQAKRGNGYYYTSN